MDIDDIKAIVSLMNEHDIVEFELEEEGRTLRMRKAAAVVQPAPPPAPVVVSTGHTGAIAAPAPMPIAAPAAAEPAPAAPPPNTYEVTSPMPGTFYRALNPNTPAFCDLGDKVTADSVVCIIEAMKVMNEIPAEKAGEVIDVLVENGEAVEYGQPLFVIKTASAS